MRIQPFLLSFLIGSSLIVNAQEKNPESDGKQMALLEEMYSNDIKLNTGSKIIKPDSILITSSKTNKTEAKPEVKTLTEIHTANKQSSSKVEIESKNRYKNVPLIGEIEYYGKMNNVMIEYAKNYMQSFARRFNFNTTKSNTLKTMEEILINNGLPGELKYLAVIESALNAEARSPVGAVGYWQFMAPTARYMGLVVNSKRDDRKHLHRSTQAAVKYLNYLYDQFDDWLLVIAAYNSGPRPVINAMKKTGKEDFWSLKKYLPKETQNHVMAFVATATIMERLQDYIQAGLPTNFDWNSLNKMPGNESIKKERKIAHQNLARFSDEELQTMALIRINKPLDLELLSSLLTIDRRQLGRWNYDYFEYLENFKEGVSTYNLRIPKDKLDQFIEKKGYLERNSKNLIM